MKALYLEDIGKLRIRDISMPVYPKGGALLRVKSVAICGTDLKIFKYGHKRVKLPWILGHEIAGIIEDVSDNTYYKIGDRVVLNPTVYCGKCYYCKRGMYNICLNPDSYGYERPGGFVEYIGIDVDMVRRGELYHIPEGLDFDEASLAEPFACVINGHKDIHIEPDTYVLIIGAGPIGIMHAIYSRLRGAKSIFIYDINRERVNMASSFSGIIDKVFPPEENLFYDDLKKYTYCRGPDVVIVAAPSQKAQNVALEVVRKRGEVLFFAGLPMGENLISIDTNLIHYKELKVFGSSNSTGLEMEKALSLISSSKDLFSRLITDRFPLIEGEKAFSSAFLPSSYKIIINP